MNPLYGPRRPRAMSPERVAEIAHVQAVVVEEAVCPRTIGTIAMGDGVPLTVRMAATDRWSLKG